MAALLPAVFMATAQPVWSRVDEAQHTDFVVHLAQGQWPVEGRTRIAPATLELMRRTGIYRWQLPGIEPAPPERSVADFTPPPPVGGIARREWTARHLWTYSYEAAQPPLFYLLALPFWWAGSAAGGPLAGVFAMRLLNAMLVAGLAPLAALASLQVSSSGRRAAVSALIAVSIPGFLLNGTAVTNDSLVTALGGLLTVVLLVGVRRGWSVRLSALAGALLGAALLTKLTAAGLGVGMAAAFLWPWLARRSTLAACLRPAAAAAAATAVVVAPWLAVNIAIYGHPLAAPEADTLLGSFFGPMVVTTHQVAASFKNGFATFWTGEPWNSLPIGRPISGLGLLWCLVAAVGIQRMVRTPGTRAATTVVTVIALGTAAWAFTAMLLSHIGGYMPGRYVYPALVATVVVLVQGGGAALSSPRMRPLAVAGVAAFAALAIADVAGYAAGLTAAPRPTSLVPPSSGQSRGIAASASLDGVTMTADNVVSDPARGRLFVHLRIRNGSAAPMEWWPVAVLVAADGSVVDSNYPEGTPLPQEVAPGSAVEGWVVFDAVPAADQDRAFRVGFEGVATARYHLYGDLWTQIRGAGG